MNEIFFLSHVACCAGLLDSQGVADTRRHDTGITGGEA